MKKTAITALLLFSANLSFAETCPCQRLGATVNSVTIAGENELMVNVSSSAQPVPTNLYVVVGQGFNNVPQTVAEVRQYYTMFLAAMTAGNKVDIIYGWTADPRPLIQKATIYKK